MTNIATIAALIGYFGSIFGLLTFLVKLWHKLKDVVGGQQCQLRNDITSIFYAHVDETPPTLREYERKNVEELYEGYKALGGNHFVDDIYHKMREWNVIP